MTATWQMGAREALPLLSGYLPAALSFGLVANQAGFSPFEATALSLLIYAGASQFLFVGMIAGGAPLWLTVVMTLLINARHAIYAISLAPWVTQSRRWPWLMHGLTDQVFALAHYRLPLLDEKERTSWFFGTAIVAWLGWAGGTLLGSLIGEQLIEQWPLLASAMAFALSALFLVLLAPRVTSARWSSALLISAFAALILALNHITNIAVPMAAALGALCFYLLTESAARS
ncbi:AzlC family ABC transporter permease [Kushneria marisflavi]|uniref:Branched-chain amino acid transporter AzlC n=1 Tax=Kushneria marisflavi TaxID=157779 RepID=A0A240UM89_9GAMM|nr:AzlC family ABC transporter permease [Kushneria marisflavi]ART62139.1 branched-chain amino acid transporter AzlC [Kushneria marisflavi]RKD87219.1 4-azaleucine resistance transporter AzlC [Kushneria marisflavi]